MNDDPQPVRSINSKIPLSLERVIARCLEKRVEHRVQTAAELAEQLQARKRRTSSGGAATIPEQLARAGNEIRRSTARDGQIRELWNHTRVVTLTGPGGIGKTRLALQIAVIPAGLRRRRVVRRARVLADPDLVAQSVAATLGSARRQPSDRQTLSELLKAGTSCWCWTIASI